MERRIKNKMKKKDILYYGIGAISVVLILITLSILVYAVCGGILLYCLYYFGVVEFTLEGALLMGILIFILSVIFKGIVSK